MDMDYTVSSNDKITAKQKRILEKIEFLCTDLVRQLSSSPTPSKIVLKINGDDEHKQINILPHQACRLAFVMQCLSRIHQLINNGQKSTKRDIFYDNKNLYKKQGNLDRTITTICDLLDEPRAELNIISSSKGILTGALAFLSKDQKLIDCCNQQVLISEALMDHRVINEAQFILVVEKDATFQKMLDEGFFEHFPKSVLVTIIFKGKGYPDICTREVLRWLVEQLSIPIFGLVDSDPHGVEIMLTYKYGSISERREGQGCYVAQIKWLGFKPSDIVNLPIASHQFLKLSNRDFVKITKIRRRADALNEREIVRELDILRSMRSKLELEALTSIYPQFMIRVYLQPRLTALMKSCTDVKIAIDGGRRAS